jgi:hypothetical protein
VHHARQLHIDRPFERAIDLRRNVITLRRLTDDLQVLHGLHGCASGRRIDVVAGERDAESLAPDEFAVGDPLRWIGLDADHRIRNSQLVDRDTESCRCQLQQHTPCLGSNASHRQAVRLNRVGTARAALIDSHVRAAHDAGCLVVCDIELVGHHLAE